MFCIVQSLVCAISSTVCLCYSSIYVSSSLSLVPQPQQYKLEMAGKPRKESKKVCAVVLDSIRCTNFTQ